LLTQGRAAPTLTAPPAYAKALAGKQTGGQKLGEFEGENFCPPAGRTKGDFIRTGGGSIAWKIFG